MQLWYYAYWIADDGRKYIRGPRDSISDLNAEVMRIWKGPYQIEELETRDIHKAKSILRDKIAQAEGNLDLAMRNFHSMQRART